MVPEKHPAAHPSMLQLARESRGMTQAELARVMSGLAGEERISQGYVSKAEAGRLAVTGDRLTLYARALGYPPRTLRADASVQGMGVGLVHHRKKAALGAQALRRIHAGLALTRYQLRALHDRAEAGRHRFRHIEVTDLDSPSDAAQALRKVWQVPAGPIEDLVALVEQAGGLVVVRDLHTADLDAVSQWGGGHEAPLFLLNAHAPGDRFRFSVAHELGHVVMHPEPGGTALQERQADEFASELLMPAADIAGSFGRNLDLPTLLVLKQHWRVSMAALIRRAVSLAAVTEWQYRNLMIEMSTLGYRLREPGEIPRECPHTVRATARMLTDTHGLEQAAELAGLLPEEFQALYLNDSGAAGNHGDPHCTREVRR